MDTSVKPPAAFFAIDVDGVSKTPDNVDWLNDRVLAFEYAEAVLGPTNLRLLYPLLHPLLRTAALVQVSTFNIAGTLMVPTGEGDLNIDDHTLWITFPVAMDQTVIPVDGDFLWTQGGDEISFDSIAWSSATVLEIHGNIDGGSIINCDFNYPNPTPRLRCLSERQVCPFFLDNYPFP